MTRPQLRLSAVILIALMAVVGVNALDHLPSGVRAQIDAERPALTAAQQQLAGTKAAIDAQVRSEAALFAALPFGAQWSDRFSQAEAGLRSAQRDGDELAQLRKKDRHSDGQQAERLLADEKKLRTQSLASAAAIQTEAAHWVDAKNHLADQLPPLEHDYQTVHAFDLGPISATVQKTETDWPEKRADLDARLASERALITQADAQWQTTAEARRRAAAGNATGEDAAALLGFQANLQTAAAVLPKTTAELQTLSGQLYTSWDKLLVDMQTTRGSGDSREYQQKIRTVRTHLADAAAKTGEVTSDEQWATVPRPTYDAMRNDLGMAIEHKAAGKYDYEADHVTQPAGFAYVAPPSQGSNQYGYWDHRDGRDFWVFYGQYALMRDLLFNHSYRPFDRYEWEDYRTYHSRGQTYYGHDPGSNAPKYGSQGTQTQTGYSGSSYAKSGGFRDSQYASKPGNYRSSQYASPSAKDPNADHSPKSFGRNASPSQPRVAPRPAPAPRMPSRSPGRSFGRHR